eukprot:scaffold13531_cov13-Tisochrysis_lutea.AAC.1
MRLLKNDTGSLMTSSHPTSRRASVRVMLSITQINATDQIGHLKAWQYELLAHIFPRIVRKSIIFQFEGSFEKEMQETHIQGLGQP